MINRKRFIGIIGLLLMLTMVMPLTVSADSDDANITIMTDEEVQRVLLANGVNLDKLPMARAELTGYNIIVEDENNRVSVAFYTIGSIVANEIGVKGLDLIEAGNGSAVKLVNDYKNCGHFVKMHYGGFYYDTPKKGYAYYARGTNYAIFTTTNYNRFVNSYPVNY